MEVDQEVLIADAVDGVEGMADAWQKATCSGIGSDAGVGACENRIGRCLATNR